jgi:hypothetical protein
MTRTIITSTFIAAVAALAAGHLASEVRAEEGARVVMRATAPGQFFVDCWIGMKWGDQPGQLIRGWICEQPFVAAPRTGHLSAPSGSPRTLREDADVAAIGLLGARR